MGRKKNIIVGYIILCLVFVILLQIGILQRGDLVVEALVFVFFPVALPYLFLRSILSGPH